ncbi:unnamed protein product [Malus baccata var. baccata]
MTVCQYHTIISPHDMLNFTLVCRLFGSRHGAPTNKETPFKYFSVKLKKEDFRFQRFIESFKQLQVSSQEYIVKYILKTLLDNILEYCKFVPSAEAAYASTYWFEEDLPFVHEFMKVKTPNLRGGGATAQGGGATAITQGSQGTSQQSGR